MIETLIAVPAIIAAFTGLAGWLIRTDHRPTH
jgi:hypothetical protein